MNQINHNLYKVFQHIRSTSKGNKAEMGRRFEELMLRFFKKDSVYSNEFEEVWLWKQYPERKHRDLGIDLVAKKRNGEKVAIQCKFYSENTTLNKEDIDSFLNELGKKEFSSGIIVSTTDNWSDNAQKALKNRSKKCVKIGIDGLLDSDIIDWWALYKKNEKTSHQKKKLRSHQKTALKKVIEGFQKSDRGKLLMPCGTGKTFTALSIAEKLTKNQSTVLVLMPSLALVSQTHREFIQNTKQGMNAFIVCSDKKAGQDEEDISSEDLSMPPTTDSKELGQKIKEYKKLNNKMNVIFSTYHSIEVISKAQKDFNLESLDLIICDEAHRTTGVESKKQDKKASYWMLVHDNTFIKAKKRLYMTATSRVYTKAIKKKALNREYDIFSMDDQKQYGEIFYELKFSEAISKSLLSDYKVIVLAVNEDSISEAMQEAFGQDEEINVDSAVKMVGCWNALSKNFLNQEESMILGDGYEILGNGYKDIKNKKPMKRAVAFSNTIKNSKKFESYFQEVISSFLVNKNDNALDCHVKHVDGTMNSLEKGRDIRWLKGEIDTIDENKCRILSNARCLQEGVDVPSLDAVMFFEPRGSEIDIIQSVGRVMRKSQNPNQEKEFGYIILPVVIPSGADVKKTLDNNKSWSIIWKVVQALRSHDDRLESEIDKINFTKKLPSNIIPIVPQLEDKHAEEIQKTLRYKFAKDWKNAIVAKLVLKCGDREYIDKLAKNVKEAFDKLNNRMAHSLRGKNSQYKEVLEGFLKNLRSILNESITEKEAIEMLAMHSVTKPLFKALFDTKDGFPEKNSVSRSMDKALKLFEAQIKAETSNLEKNYENIKQRVKDINSLEGKQNLIKELYERVFKIGFPKVQERLGIVYTPIEIVDFILESSHEILKQEFNQKEGLSSENVKVLDPFSGTGSFISRLIENEKIILDKDLKYKYNNEILSSEMNLLAYYITTINAESSYHFRKLKILEKNKDKDKGKDKGKGKGKGNLSKNYEEFKGAIFTDTFQALEDSNDQTKFDFFQENKRKKNRLKKEEIRVIVGNPPYSARQKNENDNNKNLKYPKLDEQIRNTYFKDSKATAKKLDSYVRAIKWASEKIKQNKQGGVISFVSNASFLDSKSYDGLRKHLNKDFTNLYIFNLRGNQRTSGEISKKEGGKIFGGGSRVPIAISFLVKNPKKTVCEIKYYDIGEYLKTEQKMLKIQNFKHILNLKEDKNIKPDKYNDWINQRDESFEQFASIGCKSKDIENKVFDLHSLGVNTNRDSWVYNFNKEYLTKNMKKTIAFYNAELERYKKSECSKNIDNFVNNDSSKISWSSSLKGYLKQEKNAEFKKDSIRLSLYRPFTKKYFYYSNLFNHRIAKTKKIYPKNETKNLTICTSGAASNQFSCLMVNSVVDLCFMHHTQCFPRYVLFENDGLLNEKKDNISEYRIKKYQKHYQDTSINSDNIFFYIYGLLHSKQYIQKYKINLIKELARIPMYKGFHEFSKIGKKLSDLHVNYEKALKYQDLEIKKQNSFKDCYKVSKMKYPKINRKEDKTQIIYNDFIIIKNIPLKAYEYKINSKSAIKWIMSEYQVKTDKESGIKNDPNNPENPKYILDLLQKVIYISMETLKLIDQLPNIEETKKIA